jgi:hypothetical protein
MRPTSEITKDDAIVMLKEFIVRAESKPADTDFDALLDDIVYEYGFEPDFSLSLKEN